jgi:hypothetical protein
MKNAAEMNRAHRALERAEKDYESARLAYMEGIDRDRDSARMEEARAAIADAEEAVLSLVNAIYF